MSADTIILLCVLVPMAGIVPIFMAGENHPNIRETSTLLVAGALFILVLNLLPGVLAGEQPTASLGEMLPGVALEFRVEPLGMLFALIASFLWIITSIYATGYMRGHHEENQTRFYMCFAIAIGSAMGIAFASNLLTLFVFYEILTISTYPLVTHHGDEKSRKGGRTYLGVLLTTSIVFQLTAILWTYSLTGTLDFAAGGILSGHASPTVIAILLALYMFGIGKAALMPFHRWLPAAMVAPTPVSALLHAVAVVKAGVFTVMKVTVYVFGIDLLAGLGAAEFIAWAAALTILISSLVAMKQDHLKRRLAYSTVSQLSYVILGAMLVNSWGVIGGGMHIAMHAFGKITLFFCAGAIMVAAHKEYISDLKGIGRKMPITMGAFGIAALSMIGLPPTAGFISKWYLLQGALESGQLILIGTLFLSTLLNAAYFMPIVYTAFFHRPEPVAHGHHDHGEAPFPMVFAIGITVTGTVVLFFAHELPLTLVRMLIGGAP